MKLNSERVPNKNFKIIAGRPLYQWILETLLLSPYVNQVVINTDAPLEKFENFRNHPKILFRKRKTELCGEEISMNLIIKDDIDFIGTEKFIMTHTTNPLISVETLNFAIETYSHKISEGFDSLFSVTKVQGRFYDQQAKAINHDPKNLIRTQDLPVYYLENSCLYVFSKDSFNRINARIGENPSLFETPTLESIDIDTEAEWHISEALLSKKIKIV